MLSRDFLQPGETNPFVVSFSYHHWAPWIGPMMRCSDVVLNTEHEKAHPSRMSTDSDEDVTQERLADEIMKLKVHQVRALWNR